MNPTMSLVIYAVLLTIINIFLVIKFSKMKEKLTMNRMEIFLAKRFSDDINGFISEYETIPIDKRFKYFWYYLNYYLARAI